MKKNNSIWQNFSFVKRYRYKAILYIAAFWTLIDVISIVLRFEMFTDIRYYSGKDYMPVPAFLLREGITFVMSIVMAYLLVSKLRRRMRYKSLWLTLILKTLILATAAMLTNLLVHVSHSILIVGLSNEIALQRFIRDAFHSIWLIQKIPYWFLLFFVTQLILEINEKYAPGVFWDILLGKYIQPKTESRIVMFLDLKDSTPIAEKLGPLAYFKFIREFIYLISNALIEFGGRIYQYVGDEIVVSWHDSEANTRKCMDALIEARKNLHKRTEEFRRLYNTIPEFRVGIHVGEVTIGEIGIIKRDLAMSGDTMNTTARIRTACSELNQKFIVSGEFLTRLHLKEFQYESLGVIELKGKEKGLELFVLKI